MKITSRIAAAAIAAVALTMVRPYHAPAAATTANPCGATLDGPNLPDPPRLTSTGGVLAVHMTALADPTAPAGELRYCYRFEAKVDGDRRSGVIAPTLAVRPGDRIEFDLANRLPVTGNLMTMAMPPHVPFATRADAPSVRPTREPGETHLLTNYLNVHFHGLNVSPLQPGDDIIDVAIAPGADYRYVIDIPKNEPGGMYWYHPHVHGEAKQAVKAGLTGAILIVPNGHERVDERVLVIRGGDYVAEALAILARKRSRRIESFTSTVSRSRTSVATADFPFAPVAECPPSGPPAGDAEYLTINDIAVSEPGSSSVPLPTARIEAGEAQIWHIANTAATSYVDLALTVDDRRIPLHVIGRDGIPVGIDNGNVAYRPIDLPHVLLSPAGRVDLLIEGPKAGRIAKLSTLAVDTGCAGDFDGARDLVAIVGTQARVANRANATPALTAATFTTRRNTRFARLEETRPVRTRRFVFTEYPLADGSRTDFYITELSNPHAYERPYHTHDPVAVTAKLGTTEDWVIENYTQELHAFHIHQLHFKVLAGVPDATQGLGMLLDTVNVPYGAYVGSNASRRFVPGYVRLRMDFRDPQIVGTFVYHCHILEHEDNGMMAKIAVIP